MPRRIDLGRAVLAAGSALLFISLFLKWYGNGVGHLSGWDAFETNDLILTALAAVGIFASVRPDAAPPFTGAAVPGAALLIVFVQLVNVPPAAAGADPASGAWLALAASFLMAAGSALTLAAISVTVHVRERDVRRHVVAVDRRGAGDDDLDPDAGGSVDDASGRRSLWGRDAHGDDLRDEDDDATRVAPPKRSERFTPREAEGDEEAAAAAHRAAGASRSADDATDLERTQPMSALPDEDEDGRAERP